MRKFIIVVAALLLPGCNSEPVQNDPKSVAAGQGDDDAAIARASAAAAEAYPMESTSRAAPELPITGSCSTPTCATNQVTFKNHYWPSAWSGDYQAQRNTAFCRATGCEGAVQLNHAEACAWRAIILLAHVSESDDTDSANLKQDCGKLDATGIATARLKAEAFYLRIYKKKLPAGALLQ